MENNIMRGYETPVVDFVAVDDRDVITTSAGNNAYGDTTIADLTW